jgi:hypothetical protein
MIDKEVEELLIEKEKAIYAAYKRHAMPTIDSLLADDFHEIGSSGRFYSKSEVLEAMKDIQVIDYAFKQFRVLPLDESNAIVVYALTMNRIENGKERMNRAFRSSVWRRHKGDWRIAFHQATPLTPAT